MSFKLKTNVLDAVRAPSNLLLIKPDGFYDGSRLRPELTTKVINASIIKKLFDGTVFVHSSNQCGLDPHCTQCLHPRARQYVRLHVEVDGQPFHLDLPPTAALRFVELARNGIDGALRMTCTPQEERNGVSAKIGFEIVRRAA